MVAASLLQIVFLPAPGAMEGGGESRDPKLLPMGLLLRSRCVLVRQRDITREFIMVGSIKLYSIFRMRRNFLTEYEELKEEEKYDKFKERRLKSC